MLLTSIAFGQYQSQAVLEMPDGLFISRTRSSARPSKTPTTTLAVIQLLPINKLARVRRMNWDMQPIRPTVGRQHMQCTKVTSRKIIVLLMAAVLLVRSLARNRSTVSQTSQLELYSAQVIPWSILPMLVNRTAR